VHLVLLLLQRGEDIRELLNKGLCHLGFNRLAHIRQNLSFAMTLFYLFLCNKLLVDLDIFKDIIND